MNTDSHTPLSITKVNITWYIQLGRKLDKIKHRRLDLEKKDKENTQIVWWFSGVVQVWYVRTVPLKVIVIFSSKVLLKHNP